MNRRKSLTLIEILIAAVIFAVLSAALYGLLSTGFKIRRRLTAESQTKAQDWTALDQFRKELSNLFIFDPNEQNFIGTAQELRFYAVVKNYRVDIPTVSYIIYAFQDNTFKRIACYPFDKKTTVISDCIDSIQSGQFQYYDSQQKQWLSVWSDSKSLPMGIKVSLTKTGKLEPIEKYVFLDR